MHAVEDVSFELDRGGTLGIVGESGSGKTATVMSLLGLLPSPGRVVRGEIEFEGQDLLTLRDDELRRIRGNRMALIPQNPMAALNPLFTVGWQLREAIASHASTPKREATARVVEMLGQAGIPDPRAQLDRYPHEFSGGMRQRILIAMAMLNNPVLLLADEPTTALDTTTQANVLELLVDIVERSKMAVLLITHNMGVVASMCERVIVMYRGRVVESGLVADVFRSPKHPYTQELLRATPRFGERRSVRAVIDEPTEDDATVSGGCAYRSRCPFAEAQCAIPPALTALDDTRSVRCWVALRESANAGVA